MVRYNRGHRVHAGPAVVDPDRQAEQAEVSAAAQQRRVECSELVVVLGLRLDFGLGETPYRLAEHGVLGGRAEERFVG
jgi:hypothetical protein